MRLLSNIVLLAVCFAIGYLAGDSSSTVVEFDHKLLDQTRRESRRHHNNLAICSEALSSYRRVVIHYRREFLGLDDLNHDAIDGWASRFHLVDNTTSAKRAPCADILQELTEAKLKIDQLESYIDGVLYLRGTRDTYRPRKGRVNSTTGPTVYYLNDGTRIAEYPSGMRTIRRAPTKKESGCR